MDATSSGSGFDAALKALEDLETSVGPASDDKPAAPVAVQPVSIGFDDAEPEPEPQLAPQPQNKAVAITALPIDELDALVSAAIDASPIEAGIQPAPVAEPDPVAHVPAPAEPASGKLGKVAVGLALFSSLVSAVGLVVAERTIMSAQLVVADARERAEQLEKANALIRDLEVVRTKQIELLQAQQAQLASAPVSSAELQRKMDSLQAGLMARDPMNDVIAAIRAGQADTGSRFSEFGMKMERLEAAVTGR